MIKAILDEIANASGSISKKQILESHKDNELLLKVIYAAHSKRVRFGVKQIPEYTMRFNDGETIPLDIAVDFLQELADRKYTGHAAIARLKGILECCDEDDAEVIKLIIGKDLRIGLDNSINKVIKGLLEKTGYMGAIPFAGDKVDDIFTKVDPTIKVKFEEVHLTHAKPTFKIHLPDGCPSNRVPGAFTDVKMDGRFNNFVKVGLVGEMESRQGDTVILDNSLLLKELSTLPDCVLNGEFTIKGIRNRSIANGIVKSLIDFTKKREEYTQEEIDKKIAAFEKKRGMTMAEAFDRIIYTVWDVITPEEYADRKSTVPYWKRWNRLVDIVKAADSEMLQIVEKRFVRTRTEAEAHFLKCLSRNLEGSVLKSFDGEWTDGKPDWQIKMKLEFEVEMRITGLLKGTKGKKNEDLYCRVQSVSEDGLVTANPSGGIDDAKKADMTANPDKYIGTIITVKCNELSQDSKGNYALMHPRVTEFFREDKDIADTLEQIQAIEKACKTIVK